MADNYIKMKNAFAAIILLGLICLISCGREEKVTTFTTDSATEFGSSRDTSTTSEITYMNGDKIEESSYETIVEGVGPLAPTGHGDDPKIKRAEISPYYGTSFYREGDTIVIPSPEEVGQSGDSRLK